MISGLDNMSWAVACNQLATVYSETVGSSSSRIVFKREGNLLLFETTLRIPFAEMNNVDNGIINDNLNHETDFEADPSVLQTENFHNVKLRAIITPHTVFSIPCPYIEKMWNENGKVYNLNECQEVIDCVRRLQSQNMQSNQCKPRSSAEVDESGWNDSKAEDSKSNATTSSSKEQAVKDNRYYEFGRLTPESHPITGLPCFSMHLCQLHDILQLSEQSLMAYHKEGPGIDSQENDHKAKLYLLNWCTVVGPHFGMFISPSQYACMVAQLTK